MNERIKAIRKKLGLSQTDFAERIAISRSALAKIESGENRPSERTQLLICDKFGINREWLQTGQGERLRRAACDELPGASALASDGYIAADADVIRSGELKTFLLSRYGAKKLGKERCPGWDGNLCVEPGTSRLEDMIKGVKKGLLVNRFSGGSPAPNGDFTGVAKNSFLIEDGKITRPVSETMISGNFSDILKNITEISCETVNNGSSVYPWAKTSGVTVSGK